MFVLMLVLLLMLMWMLVVMSMFVLVLVFFRAFVFSFNFTVIVAVPFEMFVCVWVIMFGRLSRCDGEYSCLFFALSENQKLFFFFVGVMVVFTLVAVVVVVVMAVMVMASVFVVVVMVDMLRIVIHWVIFRYSCFLLGIAVNVVDVFLCVVFGVNVGTMTHSNLFFHIFDSDIRKGINVYLNVR